MIKRIPNIITLMNMAAGVISIIMAIEGDLRLAAFFILLASLFDFFDGMAARLLKAGSELGKQLDSLSDLISFGMAPAIIMYFLLRESTQLSNSYVSFLIQFSPAILVLSGGYRLARFNIQSSGDEFSGLAIPATGIFIAGIALITTGHSGRDIAGMIDNTWFYSGCIMVLSFLMISKIPMLALKFKTYSFKSNQIRYLFLLVTIILLVILQDGSLPVIILVYLLFSITNNLFFRKGSGS